MKHSIFKAKGSRTKLFAAISAAACVLLLVFNLLLTNLGLHKTIFVDTTYEGLYTLTDLMKEECAFIDELDNDEREVTITFCSDPDTLVASTITRVVYFMSLQMQKEFDNLSVKTVNVTYNPTAVSKYKPTSLTEILPTDVIISYGDRYKVVSTNAFWTASNNVVGSYFGEYKMASLIMSVTSVNRPVAYFLTDHGETYYDAENPDREGNLEAASLYDMLTERGLEVKTLEISNVDAIPDDCVLLVINNPTEDFISDSDRYDEFGYISDTEKLDRYLIENHGSIMVAKDHELTLPVFEDFLYEWGFDLSTARVKDSESHIADENNDYTTLVAAYDTDENSYGYAIYGDFASLSSAPSMVFGNSGYISCSYGESMDKNEPGTYSTGRGYSPFFYTSDAAAAYERDIYGGYTALHSEGKMHLAAVTTRLEMNESTGDYKYSYIFCANSADFFSNEYLGNPSYANYEVMSALTENMSRTDEYANSELGDTSMNTTNRAGKILLSTTLSATDVYEDGILTAKGLGSGAITAYTIIIMLVPLAVAVVGIVIRVKRKFL